MSSAAGIAASGMQVASTALDVSANNLAIALTDGFVPSAASSTALPGGGAAASVVKESDPLAEVRVDRALLAPSRTDLVQEMVNQSRAAAVYRANLKVLETAQAMEAEVVDAVER
ncbi:MAG TPA: flagellar basal body rod C-terminal domain-containing protein [Anaeromyxobacter sp.]|nr:flagellar basal body rod C-terminal domain-containing protein [Anaeromyxobacter sp.]